MRKTLRFLAAFFELFVEGETKELYCVPSNFCITLFLENEEKTNKTKNR